MFDVRRPFRGVTHLGIIAVCIFLVVMVGGCAAKSSEPADEPSEISVPDGFTVEQVAGPDVVDFPTFASFDDRGRLFVVESTKANTMTTEEMRANPRQRVKILEDIDGDGVYDKSTIFADSIPFPEGGTWHDGSFYIAAAPDLLRLADTDGDDVADKREVVLRGWTLNVNGAVLSGPFVGPDGWLYMADARRGFRIETKEGAVLEGKGARIWRSRADGSGLEWISGGGFDNSIELAFTPAGETIGTMTYFTDPQAGQRDALMHWVEGGVYPKPHSVIQEDSLPRTGELMPTMTKLARIAHSGLHRYENPHFGPEYEGDLFSAQFNTGRIMRYELSRDGATFQTKEERFLSSSDPNFHPTDVVADADGSLLVVDTGGWFIKGCPLSQVAKPDIPGGIYRIRKIEGEKIEDARGEALNIPTLSPKRLVSHLGDARPFVRDRVVEHLVRGEASSISPLESVIDGTRPADVRTAAVFALFRIGTPAAREAMLKGLDDSAMQVRVAAARAAGMAKDRRAVNRLMEMVKEDEPAVRRQAATALGQIGEQRAVDALIAASRDPEDRFVEHAIIHSLIMLGEAPPLVRALDHSSANIRKAALIALDQIEGAPLEQHHLAAFLASEHQELRSTGVWVASHHPEWSGVVLDFLSTRLQDEGLIEHEEQSVVSTVVSFCEDEEVQGLVTQLLDEASVSSGRKVLLLDAIDRCPVEELPEGWIQQIGDLLQTGQENVRLRALDLVASRSIVALADKLEHIASDPAEGNVFRIEALGALVVNRPQLSESQFEFALEQLGPTVEGPLRQSAARVLAQARLSNEQLLGLAREAVAQADPYIIPQLVDAFEGNESAAVGKVLAQSLGQAPQNLSSLSEQKVQNVFSSYPDSVQALAEPLLEALREQQADRLARLEGLQSQLYDGEVGAGRDIFYGDKAICSTCHAVGGQGSDFGPDLTNIGEIRSRHDLLEAILYPSVSFAREHETYRVETSSNTYTGIIAEQTPTGLVLKTGPGSQIRIPSEEIVSLRTGATSMMPAGLENALTTEEMSDLVAFLEALPRAAQWPDNSSSGSSSVR